LCFFEGLKILELSFNLISSDSMLLFMKKQDTSSPMKVIVTRFIQNATTVEEKIQIIEFLTSYARVRFGAEHLWGENIIKNLGMSTLVNLVNQIDFYTFDGAAGDHEPRRNSLHILWCNMLLFLRTLNHILMPAQPDYRRTMQSQINSLWSRLSALLEFGLHLKEKQFDAKSISLALYEEMELLTGLVSQYFEYADELFASDYSHYVEIKDRLLFGVLYLFTEDDATSIVTPSSGLEKFLNGMQPDRGLASVARRGGKYTGLEMACDK
jgi:hypothetical protein